MNERAFERIIKDPEAENVLVNKMLFGEDFITREDLEKEVDDIVSLLKAARSYRQAKVILFDYFSEDALIERYFESKMSDWKRLWAFVRRAVKKEAKPSTMMKATDEELAMMKAGVKRIREKTLEILRERISRDPELEDINYSELFVTESENFSSKYLAGVRNLNQHELIWRRKKEIYKGYEVGFHARAIEKLANLPKNPHVLSPEFVDAPRLETLSLRNELREEDGKQLLEKRDVLRSLIVIRDCMLGARFLEENGLCLQDIHPSNLASYEEDGKTIGVLFDLDGLYLLDQPFKGRFANKGYLPPEVNRDYPEPVTAAEMVYQFGLCLRDIISRDLRRTLPSRVGERILDLEGEMIFHKPVLGSPSVYRISLAQSIERLNAIIGDIS